jgi:hypothetical protein
MSHALGNFDVTRDRFVAGRERNGPWTRGLPTRSVFKSKNGSWMLPKKHRLGHRLRLVYTMADDGSGGSMSSAYRTAEVREDAIIAFLLFCLEIFQAEQQRRRTLH